MHGRLQQEGGSCRSLLRRSGQHMPAVLPLASTGNTVAVVGDHHSSVASSVTTTTSSDSFFKEGRKISVGDCALFKPPRDTPPFIGLIRWLRLGEDNSLQLGVNWLYRPAELKLGKGILVDGAPNEIFYSFHRDETPAASLLHPCKVAFLPRGAELPAGTSSFVCRRVYDIANKCLWWLTDQDFINERQEEIDQLLYKTKSEMHATLQPGGRSPKQVNGPTSTPQLKSASDSGQNHMGFSSQIKGKKRERSDHGADPIKRERPLRTDDGDSVQCKIENNLKSEIARITEKGGLVDLEGVDKLVQLMQPDRIERKMDLVCRSMLAGVMAATDKVDCLNRFVQLRGLPVLDEWLQDIHKGKIGDGNSVKDSDRSVEEFLLVLLRALDKLPINLQALQMCNIGRSVNHLRSHKNTEIQRKARTLVDSWKKRVEAEMISIDAKSGSAQGVSSWSSKSRLPEASHGGSRTPSVSDAAMKSSITQNSTSKTISVRSSHGDSNIKSATSSPGPVKPISSPASGKEGHFRLPVGGTPDVPLVREDRSSSSNQSHNYSQSFPGKEDVKSTFPGSVAVGKTSSSGTRNRKNSGYPGLLAIASQKETSTGRSSPALRTTALEKVSQSAFGSERVLEGPITEGSNHKLIVKIPNRVRSPAQGVAGGSLEDPTYRISRASSPVLVDKHEQLDRVAKDKSDGYQSNVAADMDVDSCKNNDSKDSLVGSAGGAGSPVAPRDEEHSMTTEDSRRLTEIPPTSQLRPEKSHASMNALIESCAKYSEANSSLSLEDDVGMNLLASVAAGEMSRSELVSPSDSAERTTPAAEEACGGDEAKSKSSEDYMEGFRSSFDNDGECDDKKQPIVDGCSGSEDGFKHVPLQFSADRELDPSHTSEDIPAGANNEKLESSSKDLSNAEPKCENSEKSDQNAGNTSLTVSTSTEKVRDCKSGEAIYEENCTSSNVNGESITNSRGAESNIMAEDKASSPLLNADKGNRLVEVAASDQLDESHCKKDANGEFKMGTGPSQKLTSAFVKSKFAESANGEKLQQTGFEQKPVVETVDDVKVGESDEKDVKNCVGKSEKFDKEGDVGGENNNITAGVCSAFSDLKSLRDEANVENKEILEHVFMDHKAPQRTSSNKPDEAECASTVVKASPSAAGASDLGAKMNFDLNEGLNADDGKYGESGNLSSCTTAFQMINSLPFSVNSIPSSHSASITVAAAAKGPFVPPEDLLRNKRELGWKGSAATSAFRPAEPRKFLETSLGLTNAPSPDASTSNQGRILLDIDLNVPDERVLEELASRDSALAVNSTADFVSNLKSSLNEAKDTGSMPVRGSGGLDLDLNRVDEVHDNGHCSTSSFRRGEGSNVHIKPLGSLPTGDVRRDFDLNNGPGVDDSSAELISVNQQSKGGIPSQFSSAGLRMNNPGLGTFSSWFPPGNTYSTVAIPTMLADRGEQPFPVFTPNAPQRTFGTSGVTPFTPDVYRGSVLSSSPAMPFQSSPYQFPVFPFGATFPLPSATFSVGPTSYPDSSSGPRLFTPPVNSQLLGPVGTVTSQFQRPYMVNLPGNSSNGGLENNRKWGRQGLDLNAGPGSIESEVREDMLPLPLGQHSVASSQALLEEHARMYSVSGGILKRKEPEGGWDNTENFRHKQSSWQ